MNPEANTMNPEANTMNPEANTMNPEQTEHSDLASYCLQYSLQN